MPTIEDLFFIKEAYRDFLRCENGQLQIGNQSVGNLIQQHGLPLNIDFVERLSDNIRRFKEVFQKHYPHGHICYAAKAYSHPLIFKYIAEQGIGVDTASLNEAKCALSGNVLANLIDVNGNSKEDELIDLAVEKDMLIAIDNWEELKRVEARAKSAKRKVRILLRLTGFDVKGASSESTLTAAKWSKFGVDIEEAKTRLSEFLGHPHLDLLGFSAHIGTQLTNVDMYLRVLNKLIECGVLLNQLGQPVRMINIGGGFPISYISESSWLSIKEKLKKGYEAGISGDPTQHYMWGGGSANFKKLKDGLVDFNYWEGDQSYTDKPQEKMLAAILNEDTQKSLAALGNPILAIEPGRGLMDNIGITLAKVSEARKIAFGHNLLNLEMGVTSFTDALIGTPIREWAAFSSRQEIPAENYEAFVAGNLCFSGDMIARIKIQLPFKPVHGDYVLIYDTGAYSSHFFASNSNFFARPARLLYEKGQFTVAKHRESVEEIFK